LVKLFCCFYFIAGVADPSFVIRSS